MNDNPSETPYSEQPTLSAGEVRCSCQRTIAWRVCYVLDTESKAIKLPEIIKYYEVFEHGKSL